MEIIKEVVEKIYEETKVYTKDGKLASYIPELQKMNPDHFGVYIVNRKSEDIKLGDWQQDFTIQSVSKVLILIQALFDSGSEQVLNKVTLEPTTAEFNSIASLELNNGNLPLNPFINAGAIVCVGLIGGTTADEKVARFISLIKKMSGREHVSINEDVYKSECESGDRNRSLAYYMKSTGVLEGNVDSILEAYFKICSIEVNCADLAKIALVIAQDGLLSDGSYLFGRSLAVKLRTVMAFCGMYNGSGDFAVRVGLPSKSGVGGGIMSVSIHEKVLGIGVFGPALDERGNSLAGLKFLERISEELDLSIF